MSLLTNPAITGAISSGVNLIKNLRKSAQQKNNTLQDYRSFNAPASTRNTGSVMDKYRAEQQAQSSRTLNSGTLPTAQNIVPTVSGTPVVQTAQSSSQPSSSYSQPAQTSFTKEQAKEALAKARLTEESNATQTIGTKAYLDQKKQQTEPYTPAQYKTQGAPSAPTSTSTQGPSIIDQLRGKIGTLSQSSAEEQALQDELNAFRESAQLGISAKEGQGRGIPLSLVRGEQALLGEQASIKEQSLLDRIANATAKRQAALAAAQNEYTIAADQQARQDKLTAPMTVGDSVLQFDPATGQYKSLYTAPATAAESPTSVQEYQYATQGGYKGSYTDFLAAKAAMTSASSFAPYTLSPGQIRYDANGNQIATGGAPTPTAEAYKAYGFATRMNNAATIIDNLDQNFTGVLGQGFSFTPEFLKSDDRKSIEQAEADFVNALLRRESGAAISPAEFDNAKRQYFPQAGDSEAILQQKKQNRDTAMKAIQLEAQNVYTQQGQSTGTQPTPYDALLQSGQITPQEYSELTGSFNNALSTAGNGSAQQIAAAIRQVESGGNYNARGGSGESGAYQFMPSTWKSWAQTYLGNANAPMTQQNQDAVAQAKIQDLLNQGYNAQQIALIWNGGTPTVKRGVNRYGVAYDSGAYANKVLSALNNVS